MVETNLGGSTEDLSMKFREVSGERVIIDATSTQKADLVKFLVLSKNTEQVEISTNSGVSPDLIDTIHEEVASQVDSDDPLTLSKSNLARISQLANAWNFFVLIAFH